MPSDRDGLEILSRLECLHLLASRPVGRVATSRHALPVILPVIYSLLRDDVVFAIGSGSKSIGVLDDNVIAFEVDDIDPRTQAGWTVLAVGLAHQIDDRDPDWPAALGLDLRPWAGRPAGCIVRLTTDRVSGRRLV